MNNIIFIDNNTDFSLLKERQPIQFNCIKCGKLSNKVYKKVMLQEKALTCTSCLKSSRFTNKPRLANLDEDNYDNIESIPLKSVIYFTCRACGKKTHKVKKRNFDILCSKCQAIKTHIDLCGSNENYYKQVWKKANSTIKEKYGADSINSVEEFREKARKTCIAKYGVEYIFQTEDFKKEPSQTKLEKYGNKNYNNKEKIKKNYPRTLWRRKYYVS